MRIQHNIMAMNAYRNYTGNTSALSKNLEKLSSGYKINRAGDDAAGLAISEKMRAQITGLDVAQKNAKDGISLVQTAEGALTEVHDMLNRMVELADQSANGTYDAKDRDQLQKEVVQLRDEIDRIADSSNFNGINLLDGKLGSGTTGFSKAGSTAGNVTGAGVTFTATGAEGLKVEIKSVVDGNNDKKVTANWSDGKLTLNIGAKAAATITQEDIDAALKAATKPEKAKDFKLTISNDITVSAATSADTVLAETELKAVEYASVSGTGVQNTAGATVTPKITSTVAGAAGAEWKFAVTAADDQAEGTSVATNGKVTMNLSSKKEYSASDINNMLAKAGANYTVSFDGKITGTNLETALNNKTLTGGAGVAAGGGLTLQIGDTSDTFNQLEVSIKDMHATSIGIGAVDISTQDGAADAVAMIKDAINYVSDVRGTLGATQNRLDHTINNLSVMEENIQDAESTIRDTDVADEMMAYTKNNILIQSAQAMLAQANQVPQGVLQLLQ